jgi:hypothetical protein
MANASSISVAKFSSVVQDAVKAAVAKHPKLRIDPQEKLAISYLIWGIPVPEAIAGALTVRETQAFAQDVAAGLGSAVPGAVAGQRLEGALFAHGGHLIIGIPAPRDLLLER